jgi:transposase
MRKVQEVLRLLLVCGLSQRQASRVCGVGRASVAEYVDRAQKAGLDLPRFCGQLMSCVVGLL